MSNPVFWENKKKNISKCRLLKILPRVLCIRYNRNKLFTIHVSDLSLPLTGLFSSADKLTIIFFSLFFICQKIGFDISCRFSTQRTFCMTCKSLFSRKKKLFRLLKFLPSTQSVDMFSIWTILRYLLNSVESDETDQYGSSYKDLCSLMLMRCLNLM